MLQRLVGILAPSVLVVHDNGVILVFRTVRDMIRVTSAANRRTPHVRYLYCEYTIDDLDTPRKIKTAEELIIEWVTGKVPSLQAYEHEIARLERELEELERDHKED